MKNVRRVRFYREHGLAWVFRALNGVPERDWEIEIGGDGKVRLVVDMPESRVRAIASWVRASGHQARNLVNVASVLVIRHKPSGRFVLTQKDLGYPRPGGALKLALLGGSCAEGETALEGMLRELYEEIYEIEVADMLAARMGLAGPAGVMRLAGNQYPGDYACHWFLADAKYAGEFDRWYGSMADPVTGLMEAGPIMMTADELEILIAEEWRTPGCHFLCSHHRILEPYVRECLDKDD